VSVGLADGAQKLIGFIFLPIFARYLTPSEFGVISIIMVIVNTINLIVNPGIVSATSRLAYDDKDSHKRKILFSTTYMYFLIIPVILTVLIFIGGPSLFNLLFNDFPLYPYGLAALLIAILSQTKRVWVLTNTIQLKVAKISLYGLGVFLITLSISLVLVVHYNLGLAGRVIGLISGPVLFQLVSFIDIRKHYGLKFNLNVFKKIVKLGYPLVGGIMAFAVIGIADRWMIERFIGLEKVGLYEIATRIAFIPVFLSIGVKKLWTPIYYENRMENNMAIIKVLMKIFINTVAFLCGIIILFGENLIYTFFDSRYWEATAVFPWIALGQFFNLLIPLANADLGYNKNFRMISWLSIIALAVNITGNWYLINIWGLLGAGLASFASFFVYIVASLIASKKNNGLFKMHQMLIPLLFLSISMASVHSTGFGELTHKLLLLVLWAGYLLNLIGLEKIKRYLLSIFK